MSNRNTRRRRAQGGFTLIELLITIGVMVMLAGLYIFNDDPSKTKGKVVYSMLMEYGNALLRAKTDLSCHPTRMDALWTQGNVQTTSCGLDLRPQWNGPYARQANTDVNGNILVNQIGPTTTLAIRSAAGGVGTQWFVRAANVPNDMITHAMIACNGSATATGKCVGAVGGAGTGTLDLLFDETR